MIVGLSTATALWNSVHLINAEAQKAYSDAQIISSLSTKRIIVSKTNAYFDDSFFGELRRKGWPVTPRLEGEISDTIKATGNIIKVIGHICAKIKLNV